MTIREAQSGDLPEIIATLKASLGETSSQKNEEVWTYKHLQNPFGSSRVWLAEEQNQIVGIRAFMKWKWQKGKEEFTGYRAVDTATHPDFQGKGIFKKLTLHGISELRKQPNTFIFNTPNEQSLPGYIKMGWQKIDQLNVKFSPVIPLSFLYQSGSNPTQHHETEQLTELLENYNQSMTRTDQFFTPKTSEYLQWRYIHNPMQKYMVLSGKDYFSAFYLKPRKGFSEFRISEFICSTGSEKKVLNQIKFQAAKLRSPVITSTPLVPLSGYSGHHGPIFVCNPINLAPNLIDKMLDLAEWNYSLGDLELF